MAKWVHSNVLDNGLNAIKTNCTHMLLIKAPETPVAPEVVQDVKGQDMAYGKAFYG